MRIRPMQLVIIVANIKKKILLLLTVIDVMVVNWILQANAVKTTNMSNVPHHLAETMNQVNYK